MNRLGILVLVVLMALSYSCKNDLVDKEKIKEELKNELLSEMESDKSSGDIDEAKSNDLGVSDESAIRLRTNKTDRLRNLNSVNFDAKMLADMVLVGESYVYKFKTDGVQILTHLGEKAGKYSYNAHTSNPTYIDASKIISSNEMIIAIHQNYAIGGEITIKKQECAQHLKTGFQYSFTLTREQESGDSGCAFHRYEEYEIIAKVESAHFGTGGDFFVFADNKGNEHTFYNSIEFGVNLHDIFPDLNPMCEKNPYHNKEFRIIYKVANVEDHRSYRIEPIVSFIEKL